MLSCRIVLTQNVQVWALKSTRSHIISLFVFKGAEHFSVSLKPGEVQVRGWLLLYLVLHKDKAALHAAEQQNGSKEMFFYTRHNQYVKHIILRVGRSQAPGVC